MPTSLHTKQLQKKVVPSLEILSALHRGLEYSPGRWETRVPFPLLADWATRIQTEVSPCLRSIC